MARSESTKRRPPTMQRGLWLQGVGGETRDMTASEFRRGRAQSARPGSWWPGLPRTRRAVLCADQRPGVEAGPWRSSSASSPAHLRTGRRRRPDVARACLVGAEPPAASRGHRPSRTDRADQKGRIDGVRALLAYRGRGGRAQHKHRQRFGPCGEPADSLLAPAAVAAAAVSA